MKCEKLYFIPCWCSVLMFCWFTEFEFIDFIFCIIISEMFDAIMAAPKHTDWIIIAFSIIDTRNPPNTFRANIRIIIINITNSPASRQLELQPSAATSNVDLFATPNPLVRRQNVIKFMRTLLIAVKQLSAQQRQRRFVLIIYRRMTPTHCANCFEFCTRGSSGGWCILLPGCE